MKVNATAGSLLGFLHEGPHPYRLTDAGRAAFRAWLEQEPGDEQIRYPFLLTLAFARHLPPDSVTATLARHRAAHAARLEDYRRQHAAAVSAGAERATSSRSTSARGTRALCSTGSTTFRPS